MLFDYVSQFLIGFTGVLSILLLSYGKRWGSIWGIVGQPFWFYSSISTGQWGIFLLSVLYTAIFINGIYRHFWIPWRRGPYQAFPLGFIVRPLACANDSNPKGRATWEWHTPANTQVTMYLRRVGEVAGPHFHKGTDPSKLPEMFLLQSGKARFEFVDLKGVQRDHTLDASLGPVEVLIEPNVLHRMIPITDCIYIEYRKTRFDPKNSDTYPPDTFPA